ncbi:MAG TPA: acyl carrier protein [Puia sp.]|nr:acyl carrier protein [Puia sp.]
MVKNNAGRALELKKLVAEKLGLPESAISDESLFIKDLGIDSLDFLEIMMDVEKNYNIKIADEDLSRITSVASLIDYVNEHSTRAVEDHSA